MKGWFVTEQDIIPWESSEGKKKESFVERYG
jgi:hypothetical protein